MRIKTQMVTLGVLLSLAALANAFDEQGVEVMPRPDSHYVLRWKQAGPVDVLESKQPDAKAAAMRLLAKQDRAGTLDVRVAGRGRPYFMLRAEDGSTYRTAERLLPLDGGSNFRDLGGYPGAGGKHVRWGLLYRSGAMPKLTDEDYKYLANLHIKVLCDLRTVDERQLSPTQWRAKPRALYTSVDYPGDALFDQLQGLNGPEHEIVVERLYANFPALLKRQFKAIFDDLLARRVPLAFNCSAGQDRTGLAAGLILTALGTPREVIYADYLLSAQDRRPSNEVSDVDLQKYVDSNAAAKFLLAQRTAQNSTPPHQAAQPPPLMNTRGQPLLQTAFDKIEADYGTIDNYLSRELGVISQDIVKLRALYLE